MYLNGYQIYKLARNAGLDVKEPTDESISEPEYWIDRSENLILEGRWVLHTDQPFDCMYSVDYPDDGYIVLPESKEVK